MKENVRSRTQQGDRDYVSDDKTGTKSLSRENNTKIEEHPVSPTSKYNSLTIMSNGLAMTDDSNPTPFYKGMIQEKIFFAARNCKNRGTMSDSGMFTRSTVFILDTGLTPKFVRKSWSIRHCVD